MRRWWMKCGFLLVPALAGCLSHTRKLQQPGLAGSILDADAVQLVSGINERNEKIQTLNATVEFAASIGGVHQGHQTDYTSVRGHILFRKPQMLRVLGLIPVLQTRAFDLASDGKTFTLYMPTKDRAVEGLNNAAKHGKSALENLRPSIFVDSLLIQKIEPDKIVSLIHESSVSQDPKTKKLVELPQYDLTVLSPGVEAPGDLGIKVATPLRVIRFSRVDLMPTELDIYKSNGNMETQVLYGSYQDFDGTKFPSTITINRPLDEYKVTLTVLKLTVNQPLADDQFQLEIPKRVHVKKLK